MAPDGRHLGGFRCFLGTVYFPRITRITQLLYAQVFFDFRTLTEMDFFTSREAAWSCRTVSFLLLLLCLARRLVKKEGTFAFSDHVASVFGDFQWFQLFSIIPINFSLFPLMFHYFYCFCIKMFLTILNNFNFFLIS